MGTGFNGAETNCGIAHILGILADEQLRLLDISSNNNMPSVLFELEYRANFLGKYFGGGGSEAWQSRLKSQWAAEPLRYLPLLVFIDLYLRTLDI